MEERKQQLILCDLDKTLAYAEDKPNPNDYDPTLVGPPIPLMLNRVKKWLQRGDEVRIFTARVSSNNPNKDICIPYIQQWCLTHLGQVLEITAEKDYLADLIFDDKIIQIIPNSGIRVDGKFDL